MAGFPQVCFIKNTVTNPDIVIGDYTYYDDPEDAENFERNVLYHFPFIGDKLLIGKFCALARGVKFIMNGANHAMSASRPIRSISSAMAGRKVSTRRHGRRRSRDKKRNR